MSITYKYENGKGNYICDEEIKMLFEDALKSNETIGPVGQYTERNINNPLSVLFILKDEIFDEVNEVKGNTPIAVELKNNVI